MAKSNRSRRSTDLLDNLFRRHYRQLFQTALRILGSPEGAEDALQDGFLSAYRNLHRFEGRARFFTRLTRIVINAALLKRRASKTLPAISLEDTVHEHEIPAAERLADDRAGPERVYSKIRRHRIVNELSPLLPTASLLREVEGYSTAEPATKLGVKESTLKARLWRSRQKLGKRVNRRRAHYAKAEA